MIVGAFQFSNALHLPTAISTQNITSTKCPAYINGLVRQCWIVCVISFFIAFFNGGVIFAYSYVGVGSKLVMFQERLANYTTGHNVTMGDYSYLNTEVGSGLQLFLDSSSDIWPSEATEWNNRKIFTIVSTIGIPLAWLGSYLCTRLYLTMDPLEMDFEEEKWLDLNTGNIISFNKIL